MCVCVSHCTGVHGCLLAAVLLGKLTRYAYFHNTGMCLEASRMAAVLVRALFCADAIHPQRMVGFATYVPRELWQGVNVFADPYRCVGTHTHTHTHTHTPL